MTSIRGILAQKGPAVITIEPAATVYEAIERMTSKNVGSLVVTNDDGVAGVITERDYLRKVALQGRSSKSTKVEEIMSTDVVFARENDDVNSCMAMMTTHRVRHLPVRSGSGDGLVGLVSIGDLVKQLVRDKDDEIKELQNYIQGSY